MTFPRFKTFLENKKKETPYSEPQVPKAGKLPKNQDGPAGTLGKDAVVWQVPDGGHDGLANSKEPNFSDPGKVHPYGMKPTKSKSKSPAKGKKPGKTTTESFLAQTREMSTAQFARHLLQNTKNMQGGKLTSLYGEEFIPEPTQTMQYIVNLSIKNPAIMSRLVREMRRNGGLKNLLEAMLALPEARKYLVEAVGGPLGHKKKLGMHHHHDEMPPMDDMPHDDEDPSAIDGMNNMPPHDGAEDDPDAMNHDGSMDDMGDDEDMGDEDDDDMDNQMGDEDDDNVGMSGEEDPDDLGDDSLGGVDNDDEDSPFSDDDFKPKRGFRS